MEPCTSFTSRRGSDDGDVHGDRRGDGEPRPHVASASLHTVDGTLRRRRHRGPMHSAHDGRSGYRAYDNNNNNDATASSSRNGSVHHHHHTTASPSPPPPPTTTTMYSTASTSTLPAALQQQQPQQHGEHGADTSATSCIAPRRRVLLCDHVTNSGAVVTLEQIDYSDAMRAYRVCRQTAKGVSYDVPPLLRLLRVGDLVVHAIVLVFLLPLYTRTHARTRDAYVPPWLRSTAVVGAHDGDQHASAAPPSVTPGRIISNSSSMAAIERPQPFLLAGLSAHAPTLLLVAALLLLAVRLVCSVRRVYVEELLVIHGVGVQLSCYGTFNTLRSRRFIDLRLIRSIVIHDAFWRYQPIFFLSSSIENWPRRLVYFEHTLPRLVVLTTVLRGMRHILYGPAEEGRTLAEMEQQQREADAKEYGSGAAMLTTAGGGGVMTGNTTTAATAAAAASAAARRHGGRRSYYWHGNDGDDNDDDNGDDDVDNVRGVAGDGGGGMYRRRHHGDDDDDDDDARSNNSNLLLLHPFDVASDAASTEADDEY